MENWLNDGMSLSSVRYTLDDLIEAQAKVIRHVIEYMQENGRGARDRRSRKRTKGPLVYGMRRIELELRSAFAFTERRCNICHRWKPESSFYKHPNGIAGLQPHCKSCHRLARIYGGKDLIPRQVLAETILNLDKPPMKLLS